MADLPLTLGRNLLSLTYESDLTERASRIAPIAQSLGGVPTVLGFARWRITDPDSGPKTFVAVDPAGGAGPVGFTNQLVGMYVLLERTGESFRITATNTDQEITLATWSASIVEGEMMQLRLSAPGTQYTSYSYRTAVASVLPPPPGIPIHDAEVTAVAGSVLTVRDGWLNGGPQPVAADGQHVGRSVRLSELVAEDEITGFAVIDGEYVYEFADVSAYQVGDWMRRAVDFGATYYGDLNGSGGITPAFPAAMTIVAVDAMANTVTVVSRDGGTSLNRVIFDTDAYAPDLVGVRIYRPVADLHAVTDSDGSAHTVTLDDIGSFALTEGPGAIEFLIATTGTSGKVPWFLDHPTYVQEPPTGIGVQARTIDRATWLGVENLVPNPVARIWTTPTSLPDGWLGAASLGAVGSATPSNFRIAKNTDRLFTRVGGQSLFVSVAFGALYFPPIPWTPQYAGQRFSVRVSMLLTRWQISASVIALQLGIMQADGTVIPWYDQPRSVLLQPAAITSGVPRPDPPYHKFAANVWDDVRLENFVITDPSTQLPTYRPTAGDIANMSAGLGLVACLAFNGGGGNERIEGYIDGIVITPTSEAPADVKEFYDANKLHQDTNVALRELGPPQFEIAVDFFDAKRMNPSLDEPDAAKGVVGLFNAPDLDISNVRRRITDVTRNVNVPGETRIVTKKRRRIADAVKPAPATKPTTTPGGTTTGGTNGGTTAGGTTSGTGPTIALALSLDDTSTPTAEASGRNVARIKFAWRTDRAPTAEEVRAMPSQTSLFSTAPFALSAGQTAYAGALPYDPGSVEGPLATDSIMSPGGAPADPTNLLIWYRSDRENYTDSFKTLPAIAEGDEVFVRGDLSGNGNDATRAGSGGGGARIRLNAINGHPALEYDFARNDHYDLDDDVFDGLTEGEMFIVVKAGEDPAASGGGYDGSMLCMGRSQPAGDLGLGGTYYSATDGHIYDDFGSTVRYDVGNLAPSLSAAYHIYHSYSKTNDWQAFLDGVSKHTELTNTVQFSDDPHIGARRNGGFSWNGREAEFLFYKQKLTPENRAKTLAYLGARYAIATPLSTPSITYVRSGGDVIVTVMAPGADSAKIAADLAGEPSDTDVRAADAITTTPYRATFAAPGIGETLHIGAFAYAGLDESDKLTVDIPYSAGDGGSTAPSGVQYVVTEADPSVPNARVLTDSATATLDLATPGEVRIDVVGAAPPALDDLTDVDAPTPSSGDVLTFDGSDWVPQAPSVVGSSFTTFSPDVPPGSPSALDDRFPGASLDGKWTTVDNNAGGVFTAAVNDGLLLRHNPNSFGKIATLLQAIPGGVTDFTVACQCVASAESAQYGWAGICMTDGATTASKLIMVANQGRELLSQGVSMEVQYFTDYNTFNTQLASITHAAPFKYFSIRRVSSTYYVGFSRDGIAWAERTITPAFTPTHLGIASAGDQGNTWSFEASARWFQFDGVSGTRRFGDAITVAY